MGDFLENFVLNPTKLIGGYEIYENDDLIIKVRNKVIFKGNKIGNWPWLTYLIYKGYFGKFKTDHGIYSISKFDKDKLNLFRNNELIGFIYYEGQSHGIKITDDGSMDFPYQLVLSCALCNLIYIND